MLKISDYLIITNFFKIYSERFFIGVVITKPVFIHIRALTPTTPITSGQFWVVGATVLPLPHEALTSLTICTSPDTFLLFCVLHLVIIYIICCLISL